MVSRRRVQAGALAVALTTALSALSATPGSAGPGRSVQDGQILYEALDPTIRGLAVFSIAPGSSHAGQVYDRPMACPHWSPDGRQIASCGAPGPDDTTILTLDTGATRFLPALTADLRTPCYVWSNDGKRLACEGFGERDPSHNGIFTVRVSDWSDAQRLTTNDGARDLPGDYSPDSKQLVFGRDFADPGSKQALFRVDTAGTGLRRLTPAGLTATSPGSWSPRGDRILFSGSADLSERRAALWVVQADGTRLRRLTVDGLACGGRRDHPDSIGCANPTWSPTGRQIAFRINSRTDSILERTDADGSDPRFVVAMGFDSGEVVDWGAVPHSDDGWDATIQDRRGDRSATQRIPRCFRVMWTGPTGPEERVRFGQA